MLLSSLTAPILMLTQTRAVFEILLGRDSGWNAQARDADRLAWSTLWRFHRRHFLVGLALTLAAGAISWSLLAWMSPALLSMLIAAPLGAFLGSNAVGDWMRRRRILSTPEERRTPEIVRLATKAIAELRAAPRAPTGLVALHRRPRGAGAAFRLARRASLNGGRTSRPRCSPRHGCA